MKCQIQPANYPEKRLLQLLFRLTVPNNINIDACMLKTEFLNPLHFILLPENYSQLHFRTVTSNTISILQIKLYVYGTAFL